MRKGHLPLGRPTGTRVGLWSLKTCAIEMTLLRRAPWRYPSAGLMIKKHTLSLHRSLYMRKEWHVPLDRPTGLREAAGSVPPACATKCRRAFAPVAIARLGLPVGRLRRTVAPLNKTPILLSRPGARRAGGLEFDTARCCPRLRRQAS